MAACIFCGGSIRDGVDQCPLCQRKVAGRRLTPGAAAQRTTPDDAYELPAGPAEIPSEWQRGAVYALEIPARCPGCRELISTIRVLRLKRAQVSFTSTLPRGGRVIVCPECERILSAELTAL